MVDFGFSQHGSTPKSQKGVTGGTYYVAQVTETHNENRHLPHSGIKFRLLSSNKLITSNFAIPYFQFIQSVPLLDEYVLILTATGETPGSIQSYYLPAINIWNHPQHGGNGFNGAAPRLNKYFKESGKVNPILAFPGDVILEGRRGQSIRFSEGTPTGRAPWKTDTNFSPVITIVNGQPQTTFGGSPIVEDVNKDPASIYLTSQNQIPLDVSVDWVRFEETKRYSSYLPGAEPATAGNYLGNQVMLSSGRIYINSNKEHVLISAADTVGVLGQKVNIDAVKTITLEASQINFTGDALDPTKVRSAIKGEDLVNELAGLYKAVADLSAMLTTVLTGLNMPSTEAAELVNYIYKDGPVKERLSKMLSKRVKLS